MPQLNMSTHEFFGGAFTQMTTDMRGKLHNYQLSLEHRYGDPRVYAAQREEMAAEQAVVEYTRVKSREAALSHAYGENRDRIRAAHKARLARFTRDKLPGYPSREVVPEPDPTAGRPSPVQPPRANTDGAQLRADVR